MEQYTFTYIDIIGIVAGVLIIVSFIPQLVTIIRNKSARDVSIVMYLVLLISQVLWIVYGVLKSDLQIIITNAATTCINILILCFCLYFNSLPDYIDNNA